MAVLPTQLFFKGNREYGVGSVKFDLILTETHNFSNTVSEHNIEDGSAISDHIRNNLQNGTLTGLVTNFSVNAGFLTANRAQSAFEELERIWKEREPVTIVTVMKVYENVAIVDITTDRTADTGEAIALNISFQQIKIVKLKTVEVDVGVRLKNTKSNQNRQSSSKAEVGRTTPSPPVDLPVAVV